MTIDQIYKQLLRKRGFPPEVLIAQAWKNEAAKIWLLQVQADMGAAREAHVRDCMVMQRFQVNSRNDLLPAFSVEDEMLLSGLGATA